MRDGFIGSSMIRGLLHLLTALMLTLCVACVVGQLTPGAVLLIPPNTARPVAAGVERGNLVVGWWAGVKYRPAWAGQVNRCGVRYTRWSDGSGEVDIPLWFPAAAFAALALGAAALAVRSRRAEGAGRRAGCGYDLRATPGRCPECGRQPNPVGKL